MLFIMPSQQRYVWAVFLLQLFLLIFGVLLFMYVLRNLRSIFKRKRAISNFKAVCEKNNVVFKKNASLYKSLFKDTTEPEMVIETSEKRYVIKLFNPANIKNINITFLTPEKYIITKANGYILVSKNIYWLFITNMFRPKNISSRFFIPVHIEQYETNKGIKDFPKIDFDTYRLAEKETVNVMMFNPVPLNIKYIDKSHTRQLLSGDKFENYEIYSSGDFLSRLKRELNDLD